jgi:hypothetical protein
MKKILIFLIALSFFASCKTFDPKYLNPTGAAFSPKLPALENGVENNLVAIIDRQGTIIGATPQDVTTYFDRDVTELMTDPYGNKRGSIVLKVNTINSGMAGFGYFMLGDLTSLGLFWLLGLPYGGGKATVEVEVELNDPNRRLVGKYRGSGHHKMICSLYNGNNYTSPVAQRISYLLAVKDAVADAKTKMMPDLERLNKELGK